ncbi:MAG: TIGR03885 family FMN-dependent LLM class oxidoreductase [Steroidobacteraceae bacterium]
MTGQRVAFSYHISHEQFAPSELLRLVRHAEAVGFDAAFSSDHLQPWSASQGHSGFTWSWLGAALQATTRLTFSAITVPCGWRYQPVVLAQALATLAELFPGRVPWIALGSGEAINERAIGTPWPDRAERHARLQEGARIMRALLAGEIVTHSGFVNACNARVWSLPATPPRLVGAAVTASTAEWLGGWADGLLTVGRDVAALERIVQAFRHGGGANKPVYLKLNLSWARSAEQALAQAHEQWRFNVLGGDVNWELSTPAQFESAARFVRPEDMHADVFIDSDPQRHAEFIRECARLGFHSIDLHNVGRNQHEFLTVFGKEVLPALRR